MKTLNDFWKFLDGKKTIIAEFYWFATSTLVLIWCPNGLSGTPLKVQLSIGAILTFLGLGHKVVKKVYSQSTTVEQEEQKQVE